LQKFKIGFCLKNTKKEVKKLKSIVLR